MIHNIDNIRPGEREVASVPDALLRRVGSRKWEINLQRFEDLLYW